MMARRLHLYLLPFAVGLLVAVPRSSLQAQQPATPVDDPFLVNSYTTDRQTRPSIAADAAGDFVVVWESRYGIGGDDFYSVQGQRFASDGSKIGAQFQVNTYTTSTQSQAKVASNDAGDFVVVWTSYGSSGGDTDSSSVLGQRFASDGSPVAGEFQVNTVTTGRQYFSQIAMGPAGDFVVVWQNDRFAAADIHGQRFQSDGTTIGSFFQVNTYTTDGQYKPDVGMAADGAFQIVWESEGSVGNDSDSSSIQGQRFASDGMAVGGQIQVNSVTQSYQTNVSVDGDGAGDFIVVWRSSSTAGDDNTAGSIQGRRLASDGSVFGAQFQVNQSTDEADLDPHVEIDDETGRFVVSWGAYSGLQQDVRVAQFQSDGSSLGDEFLILTNATSDPAVSTAFQQDGSFVVSWGDNVVDSGDSSYGIRALRFLPAALIGDFVFLDQDFDGIQDPGEPGVAGVPVHLYSESGDLLESTVTDIDGSYSFEADSSGAASYFLEFEPPFRYSFTLTDAGSDDTMDSDVDPIFGQTEDFDVSGPGEDRDDLDAGLANGVGDRVWEDLNGNGIQDGGEPGFPDVMVELYDGVDTLLSTTQTDGSGLYSFPDLDPGTYYLRFTAPMDYAFVARDEGSDDSTDSDADPALGSTSPFLFTNGMVRTDFDAGLELAVIGNFVWLDENADGRQQPYERGIAGITLRLLDEADVEVVSTVTGAGGLYGFSGVPTGNFRIEVVPPSDSVFSVQDAGDDDLIDSDVDPVTGRSDLFAYTAGGAARSYDVGMRLLPFFESGFETGDVSEWSSSQP